MKAKRIGIVGAGPAGLAALKTILEAPEYHSGEWADPVVLEAREDVGGVWLPAPASFPEPNILSVTNDAPSHSLTSHSQLSSQVHYPPTPLYDSLTTNLPHPVMAFSSFPFPPSTPLFPKASIVHSYLAAYADQVVGNTDSPRRMREYVKARRRVTSVGWAPEAEAKGGEEGGGGGGVWEVEAQAEDGTEPPRVERYPFDLLLICTGHYSTPNYPSEDDMPGITVWRGAGRAAHAVWYRNAESIPLPDVGDNYTAFQQDGKRNKSTTGGENLNDASSEIVPPEKRKNQSQEDSDTRFEEVYEKAVADAQTSEYIPHPHPHPKYGNYSDTGTGNNISNSSHVQDLAADGGRLSHATVLIVGAGPSGTDIAADLVRAGVRRVIIASSSTPSTPANSSSPTSTSTPSSSTSAHTPTVLAKPLPVRFDVHLTKPTGRVTFADGTVEDSVTFVVLATGYQVDFPFFDQSPTTANINTRMKDSMNREKFRLPKGVLPTPFWSSNGTISFEGGTSLTNSNICVFPLARHLFPLPGFYSGSNLGQKNILDGGPVPHPTSLAFLGLNVRVAPLPLVEAQARTSLSAFAYCSSPHTLQARNWNDDVKKDDLDWDVEEKAIRERWDMLAAQYEQSRGRGRAAQGEECAKEELLKRKFIAKIWHRLPEDEQFAYRDDLDQFAFGLNHNHPALNSDDWPSKNGVGPHKTREWEPRVYAQKGVLRSAWRALEARGDGSAEEWVRGVGSGKTGRRKKKGPGDDGGEVMNGEEEWVDMMERLVVWWETEGKREDEERIARSSDTRLDGSLEIAYEGDVQIEV